MALVIGVQAFVSRHAVGACSIVAIVDNMATCLAFSGQTEFSQHRVGTVQPPGHHGCSISKIITILLGPFSDELPVAQRSDPWGTAAEIVDPDCKSDHELEHGAPESLAAAPVENHSLVRDDHTSLGADMSSRPWDDEGGATTWNSTPSAPGATQHRCFGRVLAWETRPPPNVSFFETGAVQEPTGATYIKVAS